MHPSAWVRDRIAALAKNHATPIVFWTDRMRRAFPPTFVGPGRQWPS